ncbi:hypothetical protein DM02DRAFT_516492 [Periconia macrospinosa]|uniref:Zn(2)-C6 fungal-type domain-containing protein n=1 Tax=Periconia macrospinosa TaxID=97972 RepID=A0A2V1E608_9PLEO|nr:hypothetical protein DM02DRAFT_516492 [Periconia macrospinosa]
METLQTAPSTSKPRKPRPSRARGLRTTTGCLTCRKRRVKCDEKKPRCGQCSRSERECVYAPASAAGTLSIRTSGGGEIDPTIAPPGSNKINTNQQAALSTLISPTSAGGSISTRASFGGDIDPFLISDSPELRLDLSPLTLTASVPSPNSAPYEWYDLLAEDAINNIRKHNLGFDSNFLSRRQSHVAEAQSSNGAPSPTREKSEGPSLEPWQSLEPLRMKEDEMNLFQYFITTIAPILDLFDPCRQFSHAVPRLAVYNVGLLKSLLACTARYTELYPNINQQQNDPIVQTPGSNNNRQAYRDTSARCTGVATQYYYETLQYLSQNLLYPSYTKSREILATAALISTYEMFDASSKAGDGGWERHLRGIFWIQRSQDNDGEKNDALRRAVWWSWLRQDIWAAFREGRRVLTIWRPKKRLMDLNSDELATRILYICARCVDFAAKEKKYDVSIRTSQGEKLLQALDDWWQILPPSFRPIYKADSVESGMFSPIWIHPPSYAAAIQMFHFARTIVLMNQPSLGGILEYRQRQRLLDESVETVCGIAMAHQGKDLPSAFVNFQALYAAGLSVQIPDRQAAILQLLGDTLDVTKFPPKTLLDDLVDYWRAVP